MELDGAEDGENLMFGKPFIDGDVADGVCAGKANAGGEEGGCGEFHGRVYKVGPFGEGCAALLTEEPWNMEGKE